MGLFSRKKEEPAPVVIVPPVEMASLAEAYAQSGAEKKAVEVLEKQLADANYYEAFQHEGNYFGSEFNIQATAGRIMTAYTREPWIFAAATLIAKTLASLPFSVVSSTTKKQEPEHPLAVKMKAGSIIESGHLLDWKGYLNLVLGGNFIRAYNDTFTESFLCPVDQTKINFDKGLSQIGSVTLYNPTTGSQGLEIPYKQIVHHKYPNLFNPLFGMSMFTAASRPLLLDRYKSEYEMAFYLRGATASGVIETSEDINATRMDRLMRTFEAAYTGKRNWFRTIFLPKGATFNATSLSMADNQHLEGLRENRLSILAVLGIPPSLVGLTEDVNLATAEVQERIFWQNTIAPLAEFIASGWNNSNLVRGVYRGEVLVVPDYSNVQAMQGALITKGQRAKSVESYLTLNEIRRDILGYPELKDDRGSKLVMELRPAGTDPFGGGGGEDETEEETEDGEEVEGEEEFEEVEETDEDGRQELGVIDMTVKSRAVSSQDRIEQKLNKSFAAGFEKYLDELLGVAAKALEGDDQVEKRLLASQQKLAEVYLANCEKPMQQALERSFSAALSQSKSFTAHTKAFIDASQKRLRFDEVDMQAIDYLREEQRDGQRTTLARRAIETFVGMNRTRTAEVLDLIASGFEEKQTAEQIAATIRTRYGEKYREQAFTIARNEILSAISQGIKWNQDVLGEVFSETKKQWYHVGDVGRNPNARSEHLEFERLGEVAPDFKFAGILDYPRDPAAPASQVIGCRCSMVTVVPTNAVSNAAVILDR